jgi:hypothetical protein
VNQKGPREKFYTEALFTDVVVDAKFRGGKRLSCPTRRTAKKKHMLLSFDYTCILTASTTNLQYIRSLHPPTDRFFAIELFNILSQAATAASIYTARCSLVGSDNGEGHLSAKTMGLEPRLQRAKHNQAITTRKEG